MDANLGTDSGTVDVNDVDAPVPALQDLPAAFINLGDGLSFGTRAYDFIDFGQFTEIPPASTLGSRYKDQYGARLTTSS